jgi:uncharacterized protein YndB with AHSA1/START domain
MTGFVAPVEVEINATRDRVWRALTEPRQIK